MNQEAEVIGVPVPQLNIEDQTESDLSEVKSVKTNELIKTVVVKHPSLVKRVVRGDSV